jgi:hypothetical protein
MSPDWFALPPPAEAKATNEWDVYLNQTPAVSTNLNLYRFGQYHPHPYGTQRPVPVPHPQNKQYSSIETAKRGQAKEESWWQRKQQENHRNDINRQKWIRPMSESAFQIHRPNIQNWGSVLKRGY